jgi:hypothetical protein
MVLAGGGDARAQQALVGVDGLDDRRAEEQEAQVLVRGGAGREQVAAAVGEQRPVVVLAGAVDAGERLLVQQADEAVAARGRAQDLHRQLLVVDADVGALERRGDLVLAGSDLVVARLDRHADLRQLQLGLAHAGQHALGDRAEVVVVELLALGRRSAEQRAPGREQVRPRVGVALVDEEVLLLEPDGADDAGARVVAEHPQRLQRGARQRVHRAQQRDLVVEGLAGPRGERRRDAQDVAEDEGGAGRVPGRVAAGFEGRADAAVRERGGVRLALDELGAREGGDRRSVADRLVEAVVLLRRGPRERLEPVAEVGRALGQGPALHGLGHLVREVRVERVALLDRRLQALVGVVGQPLALGGGGEDVLAERALADGLGAGESGHLCSSGIERWPVLGPRTPARERRIPRAGVSASRWARARRRARSGRCAAPASSRR